MTVLWAVVHLTVVHFIMVHLTVVHFIMVHLTLVLLMLGVVIHYPVIVVCKYRQ